MRVFKLLNFVNLQLIDVFLLFLFIIFLIYLQTLFYHYRFGLSVLLMADFVVQVYLPIVFLIFKVNFI